MSICAGQVLRCIVSAVFQLSFIFYIYIDSICSCFSFGFRLGGSRVSVTTV